MTECERIVKEGIVPEEFLKEETRCDFFVDSKRKKIWAIELDLIRKFDEVCRNNNLKYYMAYGTLLGAVRHKGFVPWDDDIDVMMFRNDYEKLITLSKEFTYPYFLQTPYTDPNYYYSYAKIRNDNTTFVSQTFSFQHFHSGVFLDIFILDNWKKEEGMELYDSIRQLNLENSTYMRMTNPNLDEANKERVKKWKKEDPLKVYEKTQMLGRSFENCNTDYCADAVQTMYSYGRNVFPKSLFASEAYLPFENLCLPAPIGYESCLEIIYGNYMEFPPKDKRGTWHPNTIIDVDHPWTEVLKSTESK